MSAQPQWSAVDDDTADLLTVLADDGSPVLSKAEEWDLYVWCLATLSRPSGLIDPNDLRLMVRGQVAPKRIGAYTHRALSQGLVEYTGRWVTSNDTAGRNSGKPCRELRWIGATA